MKFEDVLPAFREGKKIRRKSWNPEVYFAYALTPETILEDDWEVVEEPKKPTVFEGVVKERHGAIIVLSSRFFDFDMLTFRPDIKYKIIIEELP